MTLQLAPLPLKTCIIFALAMVVTAALAMVVTPRFNARDAVPSLEATVPPTFGDWKAVAPIYAQVAVSQGVENSYELPYDQMVTRTYVNGRGDLVMLALAWGERQRQDIKVHRPEVCYPAQGYSVLSVQAGAALPVNGRIEPVPTVSLLAGYRGNLEAVRYWIRIGQSYGGDGLKVRWYILQEGIRGRVPDGILVRVSQRIRSHEDAPRAQAVMAAFLVDLTAAVPPATLALLVR